MEKHTSDQVCCKVARLRPNPNPETSRLMKFLREEFTAESEIAEDKRTLVMLVPAADYERLGQLISRLQSFIANYLPHRKNNLYIIIRDRESDRQNVFKFWKDTTD